MSCSDLNLTSLRECLHEARVGEVHSPNGTFRLTRRANFQEPLFYVLRRIGMFLPPSIGLPQLVATNGSVSYALAYANVNSNGLMAKDT